MVEYRSQPLGRVVTRLAGLREAGSDVVGSRGLLVIRQVAGHTGGRQGRILTVDVARRAGDCRVLARQRKFRRVVIERRSQPLRRVVTRLASLRETGRHVVRRIRLLEIRQVAGHTGGRQSGVLAIDVAGRAGHGRMFAC